MMPGSGSGNYGAASKGTPGRKRRRRPIPNQQYGGRRPPDNGARPNPRIPGGNVVGTQGASGTGRPNTGSANVSGSRSTGSGRSGAVAGTRSTSSGGTSVTIGTGTTGAGRTAVPPPVFPGPLGGPTKGALSRRAAGR